jgi:isopentenyldiphosphate isomerase
MNTKLWFRAKQYGWGWYPVTWQGWAVILMYVFAVIAVTTFVDNHTHSNSDALMGFFPVVYIMTVFLIIICYATGEKPGWRWGSEKYDVLDENGNPTGELSTYPKVHAKGIWHRSVEMYIVNSKNEVLLQRRSRHVDLLPGTWHASAAGHVKAGKSALETIKDEAWEEIRLTLADADLLSIASVKSKEVLSNGRVFNNEFKECFVVYKDLAISDLHPAKEEVAELKWFPLAEFKQKIAMHDHEFVYNAVLPLLFKYLDEHAGHQK